MALAKVEILGGSRGADAISGTLASGTNILQDSLSEAVRSGRAMADLQQGQERDLLGERESLRNFHEKKRGEEQRILESTRDYEEKQWQFDESIKREDKRIAMGQDDLTLRQTIFKKAALPESQQRVQTYNPNTQAWAGGATPFERETALQATEVMRRINETAVNPVTWADFYPEGSQTGIFGPQWQLPDESELENILHRAETGHDKLDLDGINNRRSLEMVLQQLSPEQLEMHEEALIQLADEIAEEEKINARRGTTTRSNILNPGTSKGASPLPSTTPGVKPE